MLEQESHRKSRPVFTIAAVNAGTAQGGSLNPGWVMSTIYRPVARPMSDCYCSKDIHTFVTGPQRTCLLLIMRLEMLTRKAFSSGETMLKPVPIQRSHIQSSQRYWCSKRGCSTLQETYCLAHHVQRQRLYAQEPFRDSN